MLTENRAIEIERERERERERDDKISKVKI